MACNCRKNKAPRPAKPKPSPKAPETKFTLKVGNKTLTFGSKLEMEAAKVRLSRI